MGHTIHISDELWELYDGSPSAMRDTLWQSKVVREASDESRIEDTVGTVITLQWATNCNICRQPLFEGEKALIRTVGGKKEIICLEDARGQLRMDRLGVPEGLTADGVGYPDP
jgi:hypothetical protein